MVRLIPFALLVTALIPNIAAARLCDPPSDGRVVRDDSGSAPRTMVDNGLVGPVCFAHGLNIALTDSAGRVVVSDAWIEGVGVQIRTLPLETTLVVNDSVIQPHQLSGGILTGVSEAGKPPMIRGALELIDTVVRVDEANIPAGMAFSTVVGVKFSLSQPLSFSMTGGRIEATSTKSSIRNVRGMVISSRGSVKSVAFAASAKAGIVADRRVQIVLRGGRGESSNLYGVLVGYNCVKAALRDLRITATCDGSTDCNAYGIFSRSVVTSVTDIEADVTATGGGKALAVTFEPDTESPVSIARATLTAKGATGQEVHAVRVKKVTDLLVSDSVLTAEASGKVDTFAVALLPGEWQLARLQRTVLRVKSGANRLGLKVAPGATPSSKVELVDVTAAFASYSSCQILETAGYTGGETLPLAVNRLRCTYLRHTGHPDYIPLDAKVFNDYSNADDLTHSVYQMKPAVSPCPAGYVVAPADGAAGTHVASLRAELPAFRGAGVAALCVAPPKTGAEPVLLGDQGTLVLRDAPAAAVVVSGAQAAGVTVVGDIPAGGALQLVGGRVGPVAAAAASAAAVVSVTGSVLGQLQLGGGERVRGVVAVAGGVGPAGTVVVDGATVEAVAPAVALVEAPAAAVLIDGVIEGAVKIGESAAASVGFASNPTFADAAAVGTKALPLGSACPVTVGAQASLRNVGLVHASGAAGASEVCAVENKKQSDTQTKTAAWQPKDKPKDGPKDGLKDGSKDDQTKPGESDAVVKTLAPVPSSSVCVRYAISVALAAGWALLVYI